MFGEQQKVSEIKTASPVLSAPVLAADTSALNRVASQIKPIDGAPHAWEIKPLKGDQIEAVNSMTNASFVGTVEEFNVKYRRG